MTVRPTGRTIAARRGSLDASKFVRSVIVAASAIAGVIHVLAAHEHAHHPVASRLFVVLAIGQLVWAAVAASAPRRSILLVGVAANAGVVGVWLLSRTIGFAFVPGLEGREPVGLLDASATVLEVVLVAGALYLVEPRLGKRLIPARADLAAAVMATGVIVLAVPPVVGTPVGASSHLHGHTDALHAIAHAPGGHDARHATHVAHQRTHALHAAGAHASHAPDHHSAGHTGRSAHAAHATAAPALPKLRGTAAVVRYGPFTLQPARAQAAQDQSPVVSNVIRTKLATPCSDCYLTAMEPDLIYADGSSANFDSGVMLHHAVVGDSAERDLTCGRDSAIGWMGRRFFASGNERTKGVLPAPYGYRVAPNDWWTGVFEIMNFDDAQKTVWVEMKVHYLPGSDATVKPVTPVWLDEGNCGTSEYSIPAGRSNTTWDWTSSITGRVVFAGGHVHNWGREIALSNATTGEHMCKSTAGYGSKPAYKGNIESMGTCVWDRLGTVRTGQTLRIAASYDSPEARDDVMGIVLAYVYETNDLSGGTPAPDDVRNPPASSSQPHPTHDH